MSSISKSGVRGSMPAAAPGLKVRSARVISGFVGYFSEAPVSGGLGIGSEHSGWSARNASMASGPAREAH